MGFIYYIKVKKQIILLRKKDECSKALGMTAGAGLGAEKSNSFVFEYPEFPMMMRPGPKGLMVIHINL